MRSRSLPVYSWALSGRGKLMTQKRGKNCWDTVFEEARDDRILYISKGVEGTWIVRA